MHRLALASCTLALLACHRSPTPIDAAPAAASCPPRGSWTLTATSPCAARPTPLVFDVAPGPPSPSNRAPMYDVPGTIVASGRTSSQLGPETLLRITGAHVTARGCELAMHFEYVGPHEVLHYEARGVIAGDRVTARGRYEYLADDCEPNASDPEGARCTCEDTLTIEGSV